MGDRGEILTADYVCSMRQGDCAMEKWMKMSVKRQNMAVRRDSN